MRRQGIPDTWLGIKLGAVVEYGKTFKIEPEQIKNDMWVLELEDIEKDTSRLLARHTFADRLSKSTKNAFDAGDVLYGKLRPYLNKVIMASEPGCCTTEIVPIKQTEVVNNRYLFHWLKHPTFLDYVNAQSHGMSMPRLGTDAGRSAPLVLAPINEQRRIADKLDAVMVRVDACRDRLDRVPSILKRFRQSVLAAATSGKLTEDWREVNVAQEEWVRIRLDAVAHGFNYGSAYKSSASGSVPVLRMGNIQDGRLDWNSLAFTSDEQEIAKYRLSAGDVLFNRTNSPELVGKAAVYRGERPALFAGYLIRVQCGEKLLPDYLNHCLGSPAGRDYCWQVKSDGVSQSNINAKKLAAFEFLLPPLEEQTEIVRRVKSLFALADQLEARTTAARTLTERLTPALLAKAFRGELVPQDPADEPAAALLARIQASQGQAPQASKGTRHRKMATPGNPSSPRESAC
jgi:type I restriction enzyme S subunit